MPNVMYYNSDHLTIWPAQVKLKVILRYIEIKGHSVLGLQLGISRLLLSSMLIIIISLCGLLAYHGILYIIPMYTCTHEFIKYSKYFTGTICWGDFSYTIWTTNTWSSFLIWFNYIHSFPGVLIRFNGIHSCDDQWREWNTWLINFM